MTELLEAANKEDQDGHTPLYHAVANNQKHSVGFYIKNGAKASEDLNELFDFKRIIKKEILYKLLHLAVGSNSALAAKVLKQLLEITSIEETSRLTLLSRSIYLGDDHSRALLTTINPKRITQNNLEGHTLMHYLAFILQSIEKDLSQANQSSSAESGLTTAQDKLVRYIKEAITKGTDIDVKDKNAFTARELLKQTSMASYIVEVTPRRHTL